VVANLELGNVLGSGAEPPVGSRGRAPGHSPWSRVRGLEADSFFVFGYPKGGTSFHITSKFPKLRKPHIFPVTSH